MTRAEQRLILSYAERKTSSAWQKLAEAAISQATAATEPPAPPAAAQLAPEDAAVDQIMERPLVSAQYDSSVSVTDVALFEACPRKYYLGTYLGLNPTPQGPGTGAIELGLEVHRALAGHPVDSPEALELAGNFQRSELALRAARAVRLEREFDFMLALEDVAVSGQIDLWFEEGGELIVVDYKTDRDDASAGAYALQLRLYGLALEKYAGRIPERAVLYYLRHNRALEVSLAAGELDAARGAVRALRDAQNGLEFPLQVGEQCGRCAFLGGLCPAGRSD
jgi:ATP-dependent exoDNAse (exonuclease V) beta subunit